MKQDANPTRWDAAGSVMTHRLKFLIILLALVGTTAAVGAAMSVGFQDEAPVSVIKITIGKDAGDQYEREIRKFADQ